MAALPKQPFCEPLSKKEREFIRIRFAVSVGALGNISVFWSPTTRRIYARSLPHDEAQLFRRGGGRVPLPLDCVRVGIYLHPFNSGAFVDDLQETIRLLNLQAA